VKEGHHKAPISMIWFSALQARVKTSLGAWQGVRFRVPGPPSNEDNCCRFSRVASASLPRPSAGAPNVLFASLSNSAMR
jgi:hypothetical protein